MTVALGARYVVTGGPGLAGGNARRTKGAGRRGTARGGGSGDGGAAIGDSGDGEGGAPAGDIRGAGGRGARYSNGARPTASSTCNKRHGSVN